MEFSKEHIKKISKLVILIVSICSVVFLGILNISKVLGFIGSAVSLIKPLIIGLAVAIIVNVPMSFFESNLFYGTKRAFFIKIRRLTAFIISLLLIFGIIVGIVFLVVPEISHAFKIIIEIISDVAEKIDVANVDRLPALPFGMSFKEIFDKIDTDEFIKSLQTWLKEQSGNLINSAFDTIGNFISGIFDFIIAVVFAVHILFGKERFKRQGVRIINAWLPKNFGSWLIHALSVANVNFRSFISGQLIEAVIIGTLCFIGMLILRLPYAAMVGVLVGVTALIPIVGAFIGAGVGCFVILAIDPLKALVFLIFLLILQQIEGNLIYPRVMGSRVNLPGIWILAAVTIGGGIAGTVGMLLSVPIVSTVYILFKEKTLSLEKKNSLKEKKSSFENSSKNNNVTKSNKV